MQEQFQQHTGSRASESFRRLVQDVQKVEKLDISTQEDARLVEQLAVADTDSERFVELRNILLEKYTPLILRLARKHAHHTDFETRFEIEDFFSVGCEEFCKAVKTWDPAKASFYTHIYGWVNLGMRRLYYFDRYDGVVRNAKHRPIFTQISRTEEYLLSKLGRPATEQEIADFLEMDVEDVKNIREEWGTRLPSTRKIGARWDDHVKAENDYYDQVGISEEEWKALLESDALTAAEKEVLTIKLTPKDPNDPNSTPSFQEIADARGGTKQAAAQAFKRGMAKVETWVRARTGYEPRKTQD